MKIRLLFGLGGAVVGGALALFYYCGAVGKSDVLAGGKTRRMVQSSCWPWRAMMWRTTL